MTSPTSVILLYIYNTDGSFGHPMEIVLPSLHVTGPPDDPHAQVIVNGVALGLTQGSSSANVGGGGQAATVVEVSGWCLF